MTSTDHPITEAIDFLDNYVFHEDEQISPDHTIYEWAKELKVKLEKCDYQDYFEKALELSIQDGMKIVPVDINEYLCMEIDYLEDLTNINKKLI